MKELLLPELAESVVEGEILKWLVKEGDPIALEQPLCEVMTDKVTVELPSPLAGTLHKRLANEGDVVAVHAVIALIDDGAGDAAAPSATQAIQDSAENPATKDVTLPAQAQEEREQVGGSIVEAGHLPKADDDSASLFKTFANDEEVKVQGLGQRKAAPEQAPAYRNEGRILAVPAARQAARELGLDLAAVRGSGPNGRIRVADVLAHVQRADGGRQMAEGHSAEGHSAEGQRQKAEGVSAQAEAPAPAAQPSAISHPPSAPSGKLAAPSAHLPAPVQYRTPKGFEDRETRVPLRGMRRVISQQMQASHLYTVRTLTVDEVNMTKLVEFRQRVKDEAKAADVKLSYLPFIFKAIAVALKKYPSLNTSFDESTQEIVQKSYYNMGMAVATDAGLTVPVLKDVDRKSIFDLAREVVDLAGRANAGKLQADELAGSSFSVTNIGSIGALFSFPIINVPDAAIMGIHSIVKRPIVDEDDNITVAHMMYLSLSFDHRLIDGAEAARFCKEVIRLLENPDRLMLEGF